MEIANWKPEEDPGRGSRCVSRGNRVSFQTLKCDAIEHPMQRAGVGMGWTRQFPVENIDQETLVDSRYCGCKQTENGT